MAKTLIRKRFDDISSKGLFCGEGLTQQHFKDECDINYLVRHINDIPRPEPVYGDVSEFSDLQSAIDLVENGMERFNELPSQIRDDFGYDAAAFFRFANNPENYDYLVKNGLAVKKEVENSSSPVSATVSEVSNEKS